MIYSSKQNQINKTNWLIGSRPKTLCQNLCKCNCAVCLQIMIDHAIILVTVQFFYNNLKLDYYPQLCLWYHLTEILTWVHDFNLCTLANITKEKLTHQEYEMVYRMLLINLMRTKFLRQMLLWLKEGWKVLEWKQL